MKKLTKNSIVALFSLAFTLVIALPIGVLAATTPSLQTAATYGILSTTFTRNSGLTAITGDVGYTTLSGGGTDSISGITSTPATPQSGQDQDSALTALNAQGCDFTFGSPQDLSLLAQPLTPGVYCVNAAASIGSGGITLSGSGTYIFRITGALTTVSSSVVSLTAGASACDVFWTPGALATLGANSTFVGTVIDDHGITIGSTASWVGRALAFGLTVTADTDTITVPTSCVPVIPPVVPSVASANGDEGGGYASLVPLIGLLKVPAPLALPAGAGPVTYVYTVWNVGGVQPLSGITLTDNECSPVTFISGDLNSNGLLDPGENWKYSCTTTLSKTTTNTAVATGYSPDPYHQAAVATAVATVVVGASTTPPLINIVKVPSQLIPFSSGGGNVTYTYTVTNPGLVPLNNVIVSDNKCSPVSFVSGDTNGNNLLDLDEQWTYSCSTHISVSTMNMATAEGGANGLTAFGYAFANVFVTPSLPNTGFPPQQKSFLSGIEQYFVGLENAIQNIF